jgi:serine-type D-Ala-D-Ala carboxypeptidase (penicillin-binding protein 5/6)
MTTSNSKSSNWFVSILAAAFVCLSLAPAHAIETPAKNAYIIDMNTGTILFEKNSDEPMPPASMSKLMTVYMVFERLKDGRLSMDSKFLVSEKAWRKGGSKMFVKVNSRIRVEDLLRGIIIQSGNDACIVVAEGISGSESAFAEQMTRRAKEIGLTRSTFKNATGWPDPEHRMSARDIATLSQRIIEDFPNYYPIFKEKRFTYNKIRQGNRNPLLYRETGADGLKTGHTEESGYGLAASLKRNERRIVLVVNGLPDIRARSSESLRLAEWAFRTFETYSLFKKGAAVEQADVWLGKEPVVPLVVDRDVEITLQRAARRKMTAKIVYSGPVPAPIAKGAEIAKLVITAPDFPTLEIPLRAGAAVERLGFIGRVGSAIKHLIWGSSG